MKFTVTVEKGILWKPFTALIKIYILQADNCSYNILKASCGTCGQYLRYKMLSPISKSISSQCYSVIPRVHSQDR